MKSFIACAAVAIFVAVPALAQSDNVAVANALLRAPNKWVAEVKFLNNSAIGVKEFEGRYYFSPPPVVDWEAFKIDVDRACEGYPPSNTSSADLHVQFYSPETRAAIAAPGNIPVTELQQVPLYGYTIFVSDSDQALHQVYTSVRPEILRQGETLSSAQDLERTRKFRIKGACSFLADIASVSDLRVAYHAVGQQFSKSGIRAEIILGQTIDSFFDVEDSQEEITSTTITQSSSGSGFSLDLGLLSHSNTDASGQITTSVQNFRVIDRKWLSKRAEKVVSTLSVEQVCDGLAGCGDQTLVDMIVEYVLDSARAEQVRFEENTDGTFKLIVGKTTVGPTVINVDESVKSTLNTLYDNATEKEAEGTFGPFKGKFKKKDTNKLEVNGNAEFTRKGEDWIPTSLSVYLIDSAKIENQTRAYYSQIVLDELENISFPASQVIVPGLKAGFIDEGFLDVFPALERNNVTLKERIRSLQPIVVTGYVGHSAQHQATDISIACSATSLVPSSLDACLENLRSALARRCPNNHRASFTRAGTTGFDNNWIVMICMPNS